MSGSISADTLVGSTKTVSVNTLQVAADVTAAVQSRSGSAGAFSFRNKIIDGRFDFWYEGTTQTVNGYGSDTMWFNSNIGSTKVHTQQPLVAGVDLPAIDVPSAVYFSRTVVTSVVGAANYCDKWSKIENVKTLAGKTITLSFYAKTDATRNIALDIQQSFGSGGSSSVDTPLGLVSLSTTWKRYYITATVPSVTGKTISGGNDFLAVAFIFDAGSSHSTFASNLGQQSGTFDIACVQLEEGTVATPFEELPTEINLARVNRYYEDGPSNLIGSAAADGYYIGTRIPFRQIKRAVPVVTYGTATEYVNIGAFAYSFDTVTIRQWVFANAAGNVYMTRNFIADARL